VEEEKEGAEKNAPYVRILLKPEIVKLQGKKREQVTISCKEYMVTA
jgi:hypothetical protein